MWNRKPRSAKAPQLSERHYSYECDRGVQQRPYVARPSRTQQLSNPQLVPKLTNNSLAREETKEGLADSILAAREADRARRNQHDDSDDNNSNERDISHDATGKQKHRGYGRDSPLNSPHRYSPPVPRLPQRQRPSASDFVHDRPQQLRAAQSPHDNDRRRRRDYHSPPAQRVSPRQSPKSFTRNRSRSRSRGRDRSRNRNRSTSHPRNNHRSTYRNQGRNQSRGRSLSRSLSRSRSRRPSSRRPTATRGREPSRSPMPTRRLEGRHSPYTRRSHSRSRRSVSRQPINVSKPLEQRQNSPRNQTSLHDREDTLDWDDGEMEDGSPPPITCRPADNPAKTGRKRSTSPLRRPSPGHQPFHHDDGQSRKRYRERSPRRQNQPDHHRGPRPNTADGSRRNSGPPPRRDGEGGRGKANTNHDSRRVRQAPAVHSHRQSSSPRSHRYPNREASEPRERSLSPYSRRVALTKAIGRR